MHLHNDPLAKKSLRNSVTAKNRIACQAQKASSHTKWKDMPALAARTGAARAPRIRDKLRQERLPMDSLVRRGTWHFANCEVQAARNELWRDGVEIQIEPRSFNVLCYLITHRDRVVSCNELIEKVWPTEHITRGVVARAVMKLRRALGDSGEPSRFVRTVHRVGYRFIGNLEKSSQAQMGELEMRYGDALDSPAADLRIALTRFIDQSRLNYGLWVEMSLLALTHRAVMGAALGGPGDAHGAASMPVTSIMDALSSLDTKASVAERIAALEDSLGSARQLAPEVDPMVAK
jgi:DNA-binding winged helix-turn-helix (wHTH) protein